MIIWKRKWLNINVYINAPNQEQTDEFNYFDQMFKREDNGWTDIDPNNLLDGLLI